MTDCYDRQGKQISTLEWAETLEKEANRVALDSVGQYDISTVWLGLNHQFYDGPPLIFETMVFAHGSSAELYIQRYTTEDDALAGHARIVQGIKDGTLTLRPPFVPEDIEGLEDENEQA